MARQEYKNWDISTATTHVLGFAEQLKNMYKNDSSMPMNDKGTVEKAFAPAHLFYNLFDFYYSSATEGIESPYVFDFFREDEKAVHRGYYKRTEVGRHFPELLKEDDYAKPGDNLVFKKADFVSLIQDESAKLPDWHLRNFIDFRHFDFAERFLDASTYYQYVDNCMNAMVEGNGSVYKLIVDTFLAQLAGVYSYPRGHMLFRFFTDNDSHTPDEDNSKNARQFYLKTGEIRKRLEEFRKYVKTYYKNRFPYMTNLNTLEPLPNPPQQERLIPTFDQLIGDKSNKDKTLEYIRGCFLEKDSTNKYKAVAKTHRRQSVYSLASAIFSVLKRMTTADYRNWCGHEWGKDNKANTAHALRSKPENLLVFANTEDLNDMLDVSGDAVIGSYNTNTPTAQKIGNWVGRGVKFYGLDFLFPSMAIVIDQAAFKIIQYFDKKYNEFHSFHLVDTKISHIMFKLVLFRIMNAQVIELAKGQKFAVPIGWGSENLTYLIEGN